jgi:transcriptional regulator with XRE-family HTH domain
VNQQQHGAVAKLPEKQCAIAGANIRALRQRKGWTQDTLGKLMGWPSPSTVCAAEGHRNGRQRRFTADEIDQLAALFHISRTQLTTRCTNCAGQPPAGFACLACGAIPSGDRPPATGTALAVPARHDHTAVH